jgi:hypothetical protein
MAIVHRSATSTGLGIATSAWPFGIGQPWGVTQPIAAWRRTAGNALRVLIAGTR